MKKYIDAEKLIAEIEKRQEARQDTRDAASWENEYWPESEFSTRDDEDESIIAIVNSLQQEQQLNFDAYRKITRVLAHTFMKFLDEELPQTKMCLSNIECKDIDKAFDEMDWAKLFRYIQKYISIKD